MSKLNKTFTPDDIEAIREAVIDEYDEMLSWHYEMTNMLDTRMPDNNSIAAALLMLTKAIYDLRDKKNPTP